MRMMNELEMAESVFFVRSPSKRSLRRNFNSRVDTYRQRSSPAVDAVCQNNFGYEETEEKRYFSSKETMQNGNREFASIPTCQSALVTQRSGPQKRPQLNSPSRSLRMPRPLVREVKRSQSLNITAPRVEEAPSEKDVNIDFHEQVQTMAMEGRNGRQNMDTTNQFYKPALASQRSVSVGRQKRPQLNFPSLSLRMPRPWVREVKRSQSLNTKTPGGKEPPSEYDMSIEFREQVQTMAMEENSRRKNSVSCESTKTNDLTTQPGHSINKRCKWYCLDSKGMLSKCVLICLCGILGIVLAPVSLIVLMICCVSYFVPELK